MKQTTYRNLTEQIPVPIGLNERVLRAARKETPAQHKAPSRAAKRRPILPRVICATCALALALGALYLRPVQPGDNTQPSSGQAGAPAVSAYTFGIAAYAAENGKITPMSDGKLALDTGSGVSSPELGAYTGCLFRVTGDNIQTVSASIDRGGFYRQMTRSDLTAAEMTEIHQAQERGELVPTSIMRNDNDVWFMDELTALGTTFTEEYNADTSYGFWVPPEELPTDGGGDLREEAHRSIDTFDGAVLTLTVTFTDGSVQTQSLKLRTACLKVIYEEDGTQRILPEIVEPDEPYLYGVYAEGISQ